MDPNMTIKVPDAVREMGDKAVEQTEKAFDTFLRAANQSVAAIPSPAADISKKTLAFTEQNMKAAFEYARKLLHAKDMQEVMQIQADFFKSQVSATQEQMRQMVSAVSARDIPIQGSYSTRAGEEAANSSPPIIGGNMTANEGNGGTEQPAAEPEAPAATEQQAAPPPAEPVAEQPPAAEQAAAPTSDDAPTS